MSLKSLTKDTFKDAIQTGVSIVDFWAIWCGPCRMMTPVVEEIDKEMDNVKVYKVNVDDYPELTGQFNILSIPTILIFKDGELVDKTIGVVSKSVLKSKINNFI
jgi:thioredoxin 1